MGTALAPTANSPRWDVQEAYRNLFFVGDGASHAREVVQGDAQLAAAEDPLMTEEYEEQLAKEWKLRQDNFTKVAANYAKHDEKTAARKERADMVEKLRRKFRMLSYKLGGQDWAVLFDSYDKDGSGGLDVHEFTATVRADTGIPANVFSDKEVANLFMTIDNDRSGVLDVHEFEKWLRNPIASKAQSSTGRKKRSALSEAKSDVDTEEAYIDLHTNGGVPFIAEYIATARVAMWEAPDPASLTSKRVGWLDKGEVVAVTQVWGKYRLWVHRLRFLHAGPESALASSGWVGSRARGGRGEVMLERLPIEEWSARSFHETAVAQRVATLEKMYAIYGMTASGRHDGETPIPRVMAKDWVDKRFNIAEPGKLAARLLKGIHDPARCRELLDELEGQPRSAWSDTLAKWAGWERERLEIEAEEDLWRRQREDAEEQKRNVGGMAHPPKEGSSRPRSAPARRIRSRAHVEKISRDAEALGFTGSNSARGLGGRIPATARAGSPPGAVEAAAKRAQIREAVTANGGTQRPSFSGIEAALQRHSARRKVPPAEVARVMADERIARLRQQDDGGSSSTAGFHHSAAATAAAGGAAARHREPAHREPTPPTRLMATSPVSLVAPASAAAASMGGRSPVMKPTPPARPSSAGAPTPTPVPEPVAGRATAGAGEPKVVSEGIPSGGGAGVHVLAADTLRTAPLPSSSTIDDGADSARSRAPPPRPRGRGGRSIQ